VLRDIAEEIREIHQLGIEIALVIGGGTSFADFRSFRGMDRSTADYMGMLATVMNAWLCSRPSKNWYSTRVQTAIDIKEVAEPYIRRRAFVISKRAALSFLPREPVCLFHHGYHSRSSSYRDRCRNPLESHQSRRRLPHRPGTGSISHQV